MTTPVWDYIQNYVNQNPVRLHMPGHKGQGQQEQFDLTEVEGADVLYHATGILKESMENAAAIFGSGKTVYSAEGASLAIRAMVYLLKLYGQKPVIAAARNAHSTFVTAAALLDVEVQWLYGENLLSCTITPEELEAYLQKNAVTAVYLTSPDYLGNVADIAALSAICHRHGVLLAVDNAHGAYLKFFGRHPLELGADICCDSAHKTLPVLTGGAYLHIGKNAPKVFFRQAEKAMSLFASTSPSYLILGSLDRANRYLAEDFGSSLRDFVPQVVKLKQKLTEKGYGLVGDEPIKITLAPKSYGYTGTELAGILQENGMVCEFADPDYLVLMVTPKNKPADLEQLEKLLCSLPPKTAVGVEPPAMCRPESAMSMHEALISPSVTLPAKQCLGRVLAAPTVSCPPAIPVLVCGEIVDEGAMAQLQYYGIVELSVI